jgi:aldehyde:ferredoxin oxidoreductase
MSWISSNAALISLIHGTLCKIRPAFSAKMEVFPDYGYTQGSKGGLLPMYDAKTKKWSYAAGEGRILDRTKFEAYKTKFYEFEGFSPATGQPTRNTLESMSFKKVADTMQAKGKPG